MESSVKNIELIEKFIENERKSKMWAIISVGLFLVMAALVLVFSKRLSETKNKLNISEDSLRTVNARLAFLNDSIQHVKDSVDQVNIGLELNTGKNALKIDSLEDVNDTLTVLLNTTQQEVIQNNPEGANQKINDLFQQAFPGPNTKPSDKITQSILKTNVIVKKIVPPSISVLYMTKYTELGNKINKLLERKDFKVERMEPVSGTTFNPVIKYFREEDKRLAGQIAGILNETLASELKQSFVLQFIKLKSPALHLEIWIGQYEKPKYLNTQLMEKASPKIQL